MKIRGRATVEKKILVPLKATAWKKASSMKRQLSQTRRKNTWASQKARLKEDFTAIGNHSKTAALEIPRSSVNTYGT